MARGRETGARGLVLESEMLWLESVWIDQTRHATAFGHDRTASLRLEFADFERRLLRQFSDATCLGWGQPPLRHPEADHQPIARQHWPQRG